MTVTFVHAGEEPPHEWDASVFIAGPMPRTADVPSWRPAALTAVASAWTADGDLVVFVPEPRDGVPLKYDHHAWEDRWLAVVDVIAFWVPRDLQRLPGLTTNVEFGRWEGSGRVVFGAPPQAAHVGYLRECAVRVGAPSVDTLDELAATIVGRIGHGARRAGVQCQVPLSVWGRPEFQAWWQRSGQMFDELRVVWTDGDGRYLVRAGSGDASNTQVVAFGEVTQARQAAGPG